MLSIYPPFPVGEYWAEKPLAGRAMDRADSVAGTGCAFDRTRPVLAYPFGEAEWATGEGRIFWLSFLCEQKSDSRAGRREKRFTNLVTA